MDGGSLPPWPQPTAEQYREWANLVRQKAAAMKSRLLAGKWEDLQMKRAALAVLLALGGLALTQPAHAVVCAAGVYRAGCVGPHGAAVVRRPYYHQSHAVTCAAGVYRAGCVGPNGAVVRRRY
jgi:hypothetical protein